MTRQEQRRFIRVSCNAAASSIIESITEGIVPKDFDEAALTQLLADGFAKDAKEYRRDRLARQRAALAA